MTNHGRPSRPLASDARLGEHRVMDDSGLFTYPWPGPGNSEGPVDPEGWVAVAAVGRSIDWELEESLLSTSAWPGPGDSEG